MKELERFLNTITSKGTRKAYEANINLFLEYKGIDNLEDFKKLTMDDYYEWRNYLLSDKNNTGNTIKPKLSAISSFYSYLMANPTYGVTSNPIIIGELHKKTKAQVNPENTTWLTKQEAVNFMSQCRNTRETAMCAIFLNTGLRVSEVIGLELNKYEKFPNEHGEICSHILVHRKGGKLQVVEFNPYVTEKIDNYIKERKVTDCKNLFVSNNGQPMSTQSIDRTIHKIQKRAGITKDISAHSLRRTAATTMYKMGFGIKEIQDVLGHSSSGTTDIYLKGLDGSANNVFRNFCIKGENNE